MKNRKPTVRESPKAAMTLISAAFTNSTKPIGERRHREEDRLIDLSSSLGAKDQFAVAGRHPDGPEEGMEGDGVMSGHWKRGCLKLTGRVFSGNSFNREKPHCQHKQFTSVSFWIVAWRERRCLHVNEFPPERVFQCILMKSVTLVYPSLSCVSPCLFCTYLGCLLLHVVTSHLSALYS